MLYQTIGIDECSFIITAGLSINSVQSTLVPGSRRNSQRTFSVNNAAVCYESSCQFIAKKVVSRTF